MRRLPVIVMLCLVMGMFSSVEKISTSCQADEDVVFHRLQTVPSSESVIMPASFQSEQGLLDTLGWRETSTTSISFNFHIGDSAAVWFKPLAPCSLRAIRIRFWTFAGNIMIDVFRAQYDGHITSKDSTDAQGWLGTHQTGQWVPGWVLGHSPLGGRLWGPFPLTVTNADDYSWVEIPSSQIGEADLGDEPFLVGMNFYPFSGMGICAENEGTVPYHFFKYYYDCCGPGGAYNGWFLRSFSLWVEVVVSYYANTPPQIDDATVLNDTYGAGPYTITCQIKDRDYEDPGKAGISSAYIHWIQSGLEDSTLMTGPWQGGAFTGHIPSLSKSEQAEYWISAVDNAGIRTNTTHLMFSRLQPMHPEANILLVGYKYAPNLSNFYKESLDSLGYVYEYWDVETHHGIDLSVVGYGWNTVIPWGMANLNVPIVPTRGYVDNIWADFLSKGAINRPLNLFYGELSYFGLNSEPWNPTFGSGDFASDLFGLDSATTEDGIGLEKIFYGVLADPVSGSFAEEPFRQAWSADWFMPDWIKYTWANEQGSNLFLTTKENTTGVRYDGGTFKTVFLPWYVEYLLEDTGTDTVPSQDFRTLMDNVLRWFGTERKMTRGDVNRDGQINVLDVLRGVNIILGLPPEPLASEVWAADCNGDGTVNVLDLIGMVNVILGTGECQP